MIDDIANTTDPADDIDPTDAAAENSEPTAEHPDSADD